jgi:hypothetical protein
LTFPSGHFYKQERNKETKETKKKLKWIMDFLTTPCVSGHNTTSTPILFLGVYKPPLEAIDVVSQVEFAIAY